MHLVWRRPPRAGTAPRARPGTRLGEWVAAICYQGRLVLVQWDSVSMSSIWLTCRGGVANVE
jgi:hypothetical protein